ncbi:hypothetical protein MMYC01_204409 [Madurella mycetomatis]|uniref:Uncharacterized protein n=1 Tax=Madurella mycetomatis TaxID=100816 RepID=A0A175W661_9PEZI|nr:hypothetical protein MMYC01_204409 [Madurella mycetomatis]
MCGPETPSSTPRVGARVDFSSSSGTVGNLLFLNPSAPSSSQATHVRFHQPCQANLGPSINTAEQILVSIQFVNPISPFLSPYLYVNNITTRPCSLTGDLTKPISDSGLMQQFTLCRGRGIDGTELFEMPLAKALLLSVGQDGIIGRRVSMISGGELLADGIVGFNFLPAGVSTAL